MTLNAPKLLVHVIIILQLGKHLLLLQLQQCSHINPTRTAIYHGNCLVLLVSSAGGQCVEWDVAIPPV